MQSSSYVYHRNPDFYRDWALNCVALIQMRMISSHLSSIKCKEASNTWYTILVLGI